MKRCSICGKPTAWQSTITYWTATGTYTTAGQFALSDMCCGHSASMQPFVYQSNSTAMPTRLDPCPRPQREPVPQSFYDAFEEDEV